MEKLDLTGKKFIASYSGGKDSALAVHRAIRSGLIPLELVTTYNTDAGRSWFHGVTEEILRRISDALEIPIRLIKTSGEHYEENFENALADAKVRGAEVCVFGDIDIDGHLEWCARRCENAGITPYFPLWKENRDYVVRELIDAGYKALITVVDTSRAPEDVLGEVLTREIAGRIAQSGADMCGENGEYHTLVIDGPIFTRAAEVTAVERIRQDKYAFLRIE